MKYTKYSKYTGDLADEMSMEDLLNALSDYLLESGFQSQYMYFQQMDEHTLDALRQAIQQAVEAGDFLDEETRERIEQMQMDGTLDEFVDKLMDRLQQEDFISIDQPFDRSRQSTAPGQTGEAQSQVKFEVTDKSLDFLGFKTLRDLLGSLGRSSFGRHDTRDLATGIESSGASKQYEFGDTMNLDITETLSSAIQREGLHLPINIEYSDLQVHQCEYQSSCATVVMLDCSHSMILYGEDRFTPAKKVAMALSHLIRTQYPGDSLSLQASRYHDQHFYAGFRLRLGPICAEGHRHVQGQSLLHHPTKPGPVSADGLHVSEDEDDPLSSYSKSPFALFAPTVSWTTSFTIWRRNLSAWRVASTRTRRAGSVTGSIFSKRPRSISTSKRDQSLREGRPAA